jgi:hypothetical protein
MQRLPTSPVLAQSGKPRALPERGDQQMEARNIYIDV